MGKIKIKTYVLTVSQVFPATHKRKGQPTGFPLAIKHYDKIHTIRGNYELWRKRFEEIHAGRAILSIRVWDGKPYNSPQHEIFRYDNTHGIGVEKLEDPTNSKFAPIEGKQIDWQTVAKNDGLSFGDFCDWFKVRTPDPMAVIHFTDFRYSK
jgi:hypothetical protein